MTSLTSCGVLTLNSGLDIAVKLLVSWFSIWLNLWDSNSHHLFASIREENVLILCQSASFSSIFFLPIDHIHTYLDPAHNAEAEYLHRGAGAQHLLTTSLSPFYQWQTCFLLKVQHWREKGGVKNVKAALAFSPLRILLAKLMLCPAISIQAAGSQPSPLPSPVPARESRLQRENVINSMERKHRLSIIHMPLCRSAPSPPTLSDLAEVGPLVLSPSRSDICLLSHCHTRHMHTHINLHGCRRRDACHNWTQNILMAYKPAWLEQRA